MTASLSAQLAGVVELVFDPHELRIPKGAPHGGEWVHTPSDKPGTGIHRYKVPDPERLVIPPPKTAGRKNYYVRPEDHSFFQEHPVSPENVLKAYDAADEGTRAQGRDWYLQNHDVAKVIGGGDAEKGAILLSAYSPQKPWPYNMFQAMKSARRGKALGPGEGMAITGANAKMAQAGIDGKSVDEVMKGPKTHSFGVLLKQGDDSPDDPYGHVVIDTHALNVAVGGNLRGKEGDKAPIDGARYHQYVADQYREAARRISEREGVLMKPHQLQAITWMVQQQANQAKDAYDAEHDLLSPKERGRVKGRVSMNRNAWKVWMAYAKKHNVQLVPGVSSLAGQIALAHLIELAGERSLTAELATVDLGLWNDLLHPRGEHGRFAPSGMAGRYSHGGAFVELHDTGHRRVFAERLVAGPASQPGDAGEVLRQMHADADRLGVTIEGEVNPLSGVHARHPMTSAQLRKWYAKFGYRPTGAPFRVAREPATGLATELAAIHGHHVPGTPYTYRHGWQKISGGGLPWHTEGDTVHYHGSLGIPREQTPQFSGMVGGRYMPPTEAIPRFTSWMSQHGIGSTSERVPADSLKPIKATGAAHVVRGLADELKSGKRPDTKPLIVSADGFVIDGTQTWAAKRLADSEGGRPGLEPGVPVVRFDAPADQLLPMARRWMSDTGMPTRAAGEEADPAYAADSMGKYRRPDGSWEPGRQALHDQIVAAALDGHQREAHPVATFLGGGTASGKSTVLPAGTRSDVHIDSDAIKSHLPEYRDMTAARDPQAAAYAHEESSYLAKRIKSGAEEHGYSYTLDGTGDASYTKMRSKIDAARAAGHQVSGKYVSVDTEEAIRRAEKRAQLTGRAVPPTVIRELHAGVSDVFRQLIANNDFDVAELYDNNGPGPVLIGRKQQGGSWALHDAKAWRRFLAKAGEG